MSLLTNDDGSPKLPILISALFISILLIGVCLMCLYLPEKPDYVVHTESVRIVEVEKPVITEKVVEVEKTKIEYIPISQCQTCRAWVSES